MGLMMSALSAFITEEEPDNFKKKKMNANPQKTSEIVRINKKISQVVYPDLTF